MHSSVTIQLVVLIACVVGQTFSFGQTASSNLPPWRSNSSLMAVRGILWNQKIVTNEPFDVTVVLRNVSKRDVFTLRKYNCNNYFLITKDSSSYAHGDAETASFDVDFVRLKPGEVMAFSHMFAIDEPCEGRFQVNFHNNMIFEHEVAPVHNGIPIVNHVDYDFGTIVVETSNKSGAASGSRPVRSETNRSSSAAGSRR